MLTAMRSKQIAFQRAVWKKAGRYTTVQKRRILLSLMFAAALIVWLLLRFVWALLAAVFNTDQDPDDLDLEQLKSQAELDAIAQQEGWLFHQSGILASEFYDAGSVHETSNTFNNDQ